ncbi:PD-(D/E)XK nuclease family protein [Acetobacteraceae bacterium KSS8]|uniref:PD-(D/E)XK nuclease family protein n=2 Tax=Endosaccharibacter trunci TaxID=2812733 RepID=A0ABT1WCX3_9PROT|nr:PD-(D/E)XK nuclease family protein [Acetobacteraceae bacterium KSS8]
MRLCTLRAALSRSGGAGDWVLHSPRAWLGTAFHRLMAARPSDDGEAELLWEDAIRELLAAASGHRLDRRFASPERWPGYYLVRQRAITSAVESELSRRTGARPAKLAPSTAGTEKFLTARNGLLTGRPDQFDQHSVTEYKSALPDPAWAEAASLVDGYWRQLRLYAVLIGETAGWPATARIVSASGQVLEQSIERRDCEAEADAAVAGLQAMNEALERGCSSSELASPGEIACEQCQYQAICPAFWSWCAAGSWPQLREPAARGALESVDHGLDGDLYAITLRADGRHGESGPLSLALRRSVHGDLTACRRGTQIRIVHTHVRRDGRLRANISTCVFSEDDLPELELKGSV